MTKKITANERKILIKLLTDFGMYVSAVLATRADEEIIEEAAIDLVNSFENLQEIVK